VGDTEAHHAEKCLRKKKQYGLEPRQLRKRKKRLAVGTARRVTGETAIIADVPSSGSRASSQSGDRAKIAGTVGRKVKGERTWFSLGGGQEET